MLTITQPALFLIFSLPLLTHLFILPSVEAQQGRPTAGQQTLTNSVGMELMPIPAGTFTMGSNDGNDHEKPPHRVTISRPFYLGIHEVTRGQFAEFVRDQNYKTEAERDGKGGYGIDDEGKFSQKPEYT